MANTVTPKTNITQHRLKQVLEYDSETGNFTWKFSNNARKEWNTRNAGKKAGTVMGTGYIVIRINSESYLAHRLAWLYVMGEWPPISIDHVNMIRSDNRISNLRLSDHAQNKWNTTKRPKNKSGYKGVTFEKRTNRWEARVMRRGKRIFFGSYKTIEQAASAIAEGTLKLDGDFARN